MATIVDGKNRIPFMRGMLIHYLIQRGFEHEDASTIANSAREALRTAGNVRKKDMVKLVRELIYKQHGECDVGDLVFWERLPTSITIDRNGKSHPLSKDRLGRDIQVTGIAPDTAYQIARTLENRLLDQRRQRIHASELAEFTTSYLSEEYGEQQAQRFRLWHDWREHGKPLIILIGGASGVGKTSLAITLANLLSIPRVVATDDIRQTMRLMLSAELMPTLHPSSYTAGDALPDSCAAEEDPVISGFREQARVVAVGVRAIIARCIEENTSVIIDGVHLLPELIDLDAHATKACCAPLTLALSNHEAFEMRFAERARQAPERPVHRYLANLENIMRIQDYILTESKAHGIPVIETSTDDDAANTAVMLIGDHLDAQTGSSGQAGAKKKSGKS